MQWQRQGRCEGGMPQKFVFPPVFPPTFCEIKKKWAKCHEKIGIFLYEVVKTDDLLRVFPPWSGQNQGRFEGLAPFLPPVVDAPVPV